MDRFDFSALEVDDLVDVRFGGQIVTGRVVGTFRGDEHLSATEVRVTLTGGVDYRFDRDRVLRKVVPGAIPAPV